MNRALLMALALLIAVPAYSQNVTFTLKWTPPTQSTDGSALAASSITGYRVFSHPGCGAAEPLNLVATVQTPQRVHTLPVGSYTYAVSTVVGGTFANGAITGETAESVQSAEFCAQITSATPPVVEPPPPPPPTTPPPPNPPTDLKVVVPVALAVPFAPAYLVLANGTRSSVLAGFIPVGRPCIGPVLFSYRSLAYRNVDPVDVYWWKTAETQRVAAPCG